MCSELLRNKYVKDGVITKCKTKGVSQFWQGISKVKHTFQWGGARSSVNNGKIVRFCQDVWVGEVPLKLIFPKAL
jgi:hypothetical protein